MVTTREPGGAPGAEEIRRLLLTGAPERWDAESEALLMVAARRSHLIATVWPALTAGRIVLCDRFMDSTEAYQGWGRGLPREAIVALHRLIAGDFAPDLTFILDLPVADGLARTAGARPATRPGSSAWATISMSACVSGFLDIARREPQRCVLIDAGADADAVHERIVATVRDRLGIAALPA